MSGSISTNLTFQIPGALQTTITSISSDGTIVGSTYSVVGGTAVQQGFVSENGVTNFISFPGYFNVVVAGASDTDIVIGQAEAENSNTDAEIGFAGTPPDLTIFNMPSYDPPIPFAVTETGEVFLRGTDPITGAPSDFTVENGVLTPFNVIVPGGTDTLVQAISQSGTVLAGSTTVNGQLMGFVDKDGAFSSFLVPGSNPSINITTVNNQGEVGGQIIPVIGTAPGDGQGYGFVYEDGLLQSNFGQSTASGLSVREINDEGDILASQINGTSNPSFVFTPDGVAYQVLVPGDYPVTFITGINDAGQVFGVAYSPTPPPGDGEPAEIGVIGEIPCFAAGTMIAVPGGTVAVETLAAGDRVLTVSGEAREIVWADHRRVDLRRHTAPELVRPVRISADAFGPARPDRDLMVSPDHNLYVDGVLVPAKCLVNGRNITELDVDSVTYHHIELATHDVILANNMPAETYLDTGNRANFSGQNVTIAHPDFSSAPDQNYFVWEALGFAPLILVGPQLNAIRAQLEIRASNTSLFVRAA